jgi:serine/threonine protein kinase
MPLAAGTRLGPYEIVALLGAGGMGEVYRARDSRLDRDVAIPVQISGHGRQYSVTADGKRFLVNELFKSVKQQVTVLGNWDAELKK